MYGALGDKVGFPGTRTGIMADPHAPQRRTPLSIAFEPIPQRVARKFPEQETNAGKIPIFGRPQVMSDGSPGGRPIDPPTTLQAPNQFFPMTTLTKSGLRRGYQRTDFAVMRHHAEREVRAVRFTAKASISKLAPLTKLGSGDVMTSPRWKPAVPSIAKPSTPGLFIGAETRVFEKNRAYPKDKTVSMKPIAPILWQTPIPSLTSSVLSSAVAARYPKTSS